MSSQNDFLSNTTSSQKLALAGIGVVVIGCYVLSYKPFLPYDAWSLPQSKTESLGRLATREETLIPGSSEDRFCGSQSNALFKIEYSSSLVLAATTMHTAYQFGLIEEEEEYTEEDVEEFGEIVKRYRVNEQKLKEFAQCSHVYPLSMGRHTKSLAPFKVINESTEKMEGIFYFLFNKDPTSPPLTRLDDIYSKVVYNGYELGKKECIVGPTQPMNYGKADIEIQPVTRYFGFHKYPFVKRIKLIDNHDTIKQNDSGNTLAAEVVVTELKTPSGYKILGKFLIIPIMIIGGDKNKLPLGHSFQREELRTAGEKLCDFNALPPV